MSTETISTIEISKASASTVAVPPPAPPPETFLPLQPPVEDTSSIGNMTHEELAEIVQPLLDHFNQLDHEPCEDVECRIEDVDDQQNFRSRFPAVFVQLPASLCDRPWIHRELVQVLMALLRRSASKSFCQPEVEEDDDHCGPLWFRLVKHTRFLPDFRFWSYLQLAVETGSSDVTAAKRQVALLIDFLENDEDVIEFDVEDFLQL